MSDSTTVTVPGWLGEPKFDLIWVYGGALLSVIACGLVLGLGTSIVLLWWIWLLLFDGPHMAATYARTYCSRAQWALRPRLLLGSLALLFVGPACLIASAAVHSDAPFLVFLAVVTLWAYYHVVRQHYGFMALYAVTGGDRRRLRRERVWLYLGSAVPYLYFLYSHGRVRALVGLEPLPEVVGPVMALAALFWIWALVALLRPAVAGPARHQSAYGALVVLLMGLTYFAVALREPVYAASQGPDQDFLLLAIMVSVFHNVQYVGLVWRHVRGTERGARVRRLLVGYAAFCGLFVVGYFSLASATGVFPVFQAFQGRSLAGLGVNQLALSLWWGLALHHYYLDQRIWRLREEPDLIERLSLGKPA